MLILRNQNMSKIILGVTLVAAIVLLVINKEQTVSSASSERRLDGPLPVQMEIRVPADMWRRASETPQWNPPPLYNCCRKGFPFDSLCVAEDDPLRYYGPGMGYTPNDLKDALGSSGSDILIIGDSVSRQFYTALACWLGRYEIGMEHHDPELANEIKESYYVARPTQRPQTPSKVGHFVQAFRVPSKKMEPGSFMNNSVMYLPAKNSKPKKLVKILDYFNGQYMTDFNKPKPIIVMNVGLHFNLFDEKEWYHPKSELEVLYTEMAMYCQSTDSRCIFRETSPQHFENEVGDGLYPEVLGDHCMAESPESFTTLNNWRNDVLHKSLETAKSKMGPWKTNGDGFIKVMKIFDKLSALKSEAHISMQEYNDAFDGKHRFDDCTHFKWNSNYWEPWHVTLTQTLLDDQAAVSK
mmetsp:Transcript_12420/g.15538  ORF Transcript_12420/g.15538 Transcript_12420/m.15538 type:complete len:410 (+) Transcript_12420:33-1262(+)